MQYQQCNYDLISYPYHSRAVMTDPHVHQKLHDHHAEKWGRYIGWWYNTDIWGLIDSQVYSYAYYT